MSEIIRLIGYTAGGLPGSRILDLAIPISDDTVLRIVKASGPRISVNAASANLSASNRPMPTPRATPVPAIKTISEIVTALSCLDIFLLLSSDAPERQNRKTGRFKC